MSLSLSGILPEIKLPDLSSFFGLNLNEEQQLRLVIQQFSSTIFKQMNETHAPQHTNFFFFTPTLLTHFSMLYAGAPQDLKEVMQKEFSMGNLKDDQWHKAFGEWLQNLQERVSLSLDTSDTTKPKLIQSQIIATSANTPLVDEAASRLSHYKPEKISFENPKEAQQLINTTVEQTTDGKIRNLVQDGDVLPNLVLLMATAAIFKGQWQYPFNPKQNSTESFFNSDNTTSKVTMMNRGIDNLRMAWDQDRQVKILELPFHGDLSLLLVRPDDGFNRPKTSPAETVSRYLLSSDSLKQLLDDFDKRFKQISGLTIGVPKIAFEEKIDLIETVKNTTIAKALKSANFSGTMIQSQTSTQTPKLVTQINLNLDEEGVVIAAASYSPTYFKSCDPIFKVNGPFGIILVDKVGRNILGMGQVLKLEGEQKV